MAAGPYKRIVPAFIVSCFKQEYQDAKQLVSDHISTQEEQAPLRYRKSDMMTGGVSPEWLGRVRKRQVA